MDFLSNVIVVLHLLGMAVIVGGWVAIRTTGSSITPVLWAARIQLLTGLVLTGLAEAGDDPVNHPKIGVKLLVALAVVACTEIAAGRDKRGDSRMPLLDIAGGLAVLNVIIAVLWS